MHNHMGSKMGRALDDSQDEIDVTDTLDGIDAFVPYDHLTSKTRLLQTISTLVEDAEDPVSFGATSRIEIVPSVKTNVSWQRRVLNWFRNF